MPAQNTIENLTKTNNTVAYDSDFTDSIKAIDILTADAGGGDALVVEDIEGHTIVYPMAPFIAAGGAYTTFPCRIYLRIRKIIGNGSGSAGNGTTGTNMALSELVPLH